MSVTFTQFLYGIQSAEENYDNQIYFVESRSGEEITSTGTWNVKP